MKNKSQNGRATSHPQHLLLSELLNNKSAGSGLLAYYLFVTTTSSIGDKIGNIRNCDPGEDGIVGTSLCRDVVIRVCLMINTGLITSLYLTTNYDRLHYFGDGIQSRTKRLGGKYTFFMYVWKAQLRVDRTPESRLAPRVLVSHRLAVGNSNPCI